MNEVLPSGTLLNSGKYRVDALYKVGGQSIVYQGTEVLSSRKIILKQSYHGEGRSHEVLSQEGQLLASLAHESLPCVYDCFFDSQSTFLVMSPVPGSDLSELRKSRDREWSNALVLDWADQLLDIVIYLQAQESVIIHRDINPKNIRLSADNKIFLLDFGIAKRLEQKTFLVGGTPRYAPPEQLKDEGTDRRSDIYAIGATLYYLLTGIEPPDSLSRESSILKGQLDPLRPACELNQSIAASVSQVLSAALSLDRELRPKDAATMRRWLNAARNGSHYEPTDIGETTQLRRRPQSRVVVNVEPPSLNVSDHAKAVMELLNKDSDPDVLRILIEVLDLAPENRKPKSVRATSRMSREVRSMFALAEQLEQGAVIDSGVRSQLRRQLGRHIADHMLSERSRERPLVQRSNPMTINQQIIFRNRLREGLVWGVRGGLTSLAIQLAISLFYGRSKTLALLCSSLVGAVWVEHLLFLLAVLIAVLLLRTGLTSQRYKPAWWQVSAFALGFVLIALVVHDILWTIGFLQAALMGT